MTYSLVSTLIPVYNRHDIIKTSVLSALNQTYKNLEIVVVDNNSTDGTWEILQDLAEQDPRIRIFQNKKNIGPVKNWKRCIDEAKGEYAKILWSDDLIAPDFVEKTISLMSAKVGFVYTPAEIFGEGRKRSTCYDLKKTGVYSSEKFIHGSLFEGNFPVSPGCALFRLTDLKRNLQVDIPNKIGSDFSSHAIGNDLLLFLLTASQYPLFGFVHETKAFFRAHPGSISCSSSDGKLPLHYALAKSYFIETNYFTKSAVKKFNAHLFYLLARYKDNNYGLSCISDFYQINTDCSIDYFYFLKKMIKKIVRK
jgi:glycosyltransferase involved in cell wall biosynthesis